MERVRLDEGPKASKDLSRWCCCFCPCCCCLVADVRIEPASSSEGNEDPVAADSCSGVSSMESADEEEFENRWSHVSLSTGRSNWGGAVFGVNTSFLDNRWSAVRTSSISNSSESYSMRGLVGRSDSAADGCVTRRQNDPNRARFLLRGVEVELVHGTSTISCGGR